MRRWIGAVALALACAAPAHAQLTRNFPDNARFGELVGQQPFPLVGLDKKLVRLSPGARIYDQHNRTIVHGSLPAAAYVVYVVDMHGDLSRLYLLRPEEVERLKPLTPVPLPAPAPKPDPKPEPDAEKK